jgi:hypothetical protein
LGGFLAQADIGPPRLRQFPAVMSHAFGPPLQCSFQVPGTDDLPTFRQPTGGIGTALTPLLPPSTNPGTLHHGRMPAPLLQQALRECQLLAELRGYQQPGEGNLRNETIFSIARIHRQPSKPSFLVPSLKVYPTDNDVLPEFDFEAYSRAVATEVTNLRRVALKCVLADAWAVGKSFEDCLTAADSEILAQLEQNENWWKRANPTLFLKPGNRVARTDDGNGKICPPVSPTSQSGLDVGRFWDATVRQYQHLTGKLIFHMTPTGEIRSQAHQEMLLASVNRIGMRTHIDLLRHLKVEWQREADDRVERGNRFWYDGPIGIDVRTTDVMYFPSLAGGQSGASMAAPAPERPGIRQKNKPMPGWRHSEEKVAIKKLATQMAGRASQQGMARIRVHLKNMTLKQRKILAEKGAEPLRWFFLIQAATKYRLQRSKSNENQKGLYIAKQQGKAKKPRRKAGEDAAHRAPLLAIETPNCDIARTGRRKDKISRPIASTNGTGEGTWREIQERDNLDQKNDGASHKRSKILGLRAESAVALSRAQIFNDRGREFPTSPIVEAMEDTIVVGGSGSGS